MHLFCTHSFKIWYWLFVRFSRELKKNLCKKPKSGEKIGKTLRLPPHTHATLTQFKYRCAAAGAATISLSINAQYTITKLLKTIYLAIMYIRTYTGKHKTVTVTCDYN